MAWFAASVIVAMRVKKGRQKKFPVFENVYLIEAKSPREAHKKAVDIGKSEEVADESLTLGGRPAAMVFVGVRKVIAVMHRFPGAPSAGRPRHGTEVTYSLLELKSARDVSRLAKGRPVTVFYEE
jgi:Domain of unknown function (DUF4288)